MKQCENGHFFDENRHADCPYCNPSQHVGKTVGLSGPGKTVPLQAQVASDLADRGKTVGLLKKEQGFDPAVAFVVVTGGPHRGADYRLHSGRSFIGRTLEMDVSLADDETVSRENHCMISYDNKHNQFMLLPGTGRGITYCNGAQVEIASPLKPYDRIEVGQTTLLFMPVCGDAFTWGEEI